MQDRSPERAALIANVLVESLINHNEFLQSGRFEASEDSLQAQIDQVESQIAEVAAQKEEEETQSQVSQAEFDVRKQELQGTILDLSSKIANLEQEIVNLTSPAARSSSPFSRNLLSNKQAELQLLQSKTNLEEIKYQELVASGAPDNELLLREEVILGLSDQIIKLGWAIEDLSPDKPDFEIDPETQESINEKKLR